MNKQDVKQIGIAGFGDKPYDAMTNFFKELGCT